MAKLSFAHKKLTKQGWTLVEGKTSEYKKEDCTLGLQHNYDSDEFFAVYTFSGENTSDIMTDYFCEQWHDNLASALKYLEQSGKFNKVA